MTKTFACIALVAAALVVYAFKRVWGPGGGTGPHDRVLTDFYAIGACLKTYKRNAGHYPTTEQGLQALLKRPVSDPQPKHWAKIADAEFLDPWSNKYLYRLLPGKDPEEFEIICTGKDGILGTEDDRSSLDEKD